MTDLTHPADEVPGGLWDGAPVRYAEENDDGDLVLHSGVWVVGDGLHRPGRCVLVVPERYVHVRLSDPLGLGLAGLAARVYQRLAPDCEPGPRSLLDAVARAMLAGVPRLWAARQTHLRAALLAVASYLALTDRLAAAAALTLEPGEVATLRREDDHDLPGIWVMEGFAKTGRDSWLLTLPPNGQHQHDDPLTALRAALAAMEERWLTD